MSIINATRYIGTRVPDWYDIDHDRPASHWGAPLTAQDSDMEAAVYQDDERVWVESWRMNVGLTTFWEADTLDAAIELADYIVRGA